MPQTEDIVTFCEVDTRVVDVSDLFDRAKMRLATDWRRIDDSAGPPMGYPYAISKTVILPRHQQPTAIVSDGVDTDEVPALDEVLALHQCDTPPSEGTHTIVDRVDDDVDGDDLELVCDDEDDSILVSGLYDRLIEWLESRSVRWLNTAIAIGLALIVLVLWALAVQTALLFTPAA